MLYVNTNIYKRIWNTSKWVKVCLRIAVTHTLWEGGSAGTSVQCPESQEGLFHFLEGIFNSNAQFLEKSQPVPRAPKQWGSAWQNVSWMTCRHDITEMLLKVALNTITLTFVCGLLWFLSKSYEEGLCPYN